MINEVIDNINITGKSMKLEQYELDLLNEFERRTDNWIYRDFDIKLSKIKHGYNYQDSKGIIINAHSIGKWPKTIKRYILTNRKFYGNTSGELVSTFNSIYSRMSDNEKKQWEIE